MKWYVIQVYAGYEEVVKKDLEQRIQEQHLEHLFGQVLVPSAKMKNFFDAGDALHDEQLFPGYILIELEDAPQAFRLVTKTPRVTRFLGGKDPVALSKREIERIIGQVKGEVALAPREVAAVEVGKEVEITDGPFIGFSGVIDSVDEGAERLVIMVSIFGRMTPVELRFDQIKQ